MILIILRQEDNTNKFLMVGKDDYNNTKMLEYILGTLNNIFVTQRDFNKTHIDNSIINAEHHQLIEIINHLFPNIIIKVNDKWEGYEEYCIPDTNNLSPYAIIPTKLDKSYDKSSIYNYVKKEDGGFVVSTYNSKILWNKEEYNKFMKYFYRKEIKERDPNYFGF